MKGILILLVFIVSPFLCAVDKDAEMFLRCRGTGLTKKELLHAFHFIKKNLQKKKPVYSAHETRLPCEIEFSRPLHAYIVRKIQRAKAYIGRGLHKKVSKVILCSDAPKVIAECSSDYNSRSRKEIQILKKTRGFKGLVPYLGSQIRGRKTSIFLDYYPQGSLGQYLQDKKPLSKSNILKIAHDSSRGLASLHKKQFIHRDLHAGNILLKIQGDLCKAVFVDFGQTLSVHRAMSEFPQACSSKNPPEVLLKSLSKIDRFRTDIYALGCLFYQMTWRERVPWEKVFDVCKINGYSQSHKKNLYKKIVRIYTKTKEQKLKSIYKKQQVQQPLTQFEEFQLLIFKMISYNVKDRLNSFELISTFPE